jgi:hypothetical protein
MDKPMTLDHAVGVMDDLMVHTSEQYKSGRAWKVIKDHLVREQKKVTDGDVDRIAKMIADRVGNGMREKYIDLAYRIIESLPDDAEGK